MWRQFACNFTGQEQTAVAIRKAHVNEFGNCKFLTLRVEKEIRHNFMRLFPSINSNDDSFSIMLVGFFH